MSAGLERLKAKLRTHGAAAIEAAQAQARKEADIIVGFAKAAAPEEEGALIRSIRVEEADTLTTKSGAEIGFVGVNVVAGDETTIITNKRGQKFQKAKLFEGGFLHEKKGGGMMVVQRPFLNFAKRARLKAARANIIRAVNKAWKSGG